jgi:hemerythrin
VYETVRKKVAAVMEADDSFLDRMVKVRILERDRWNDVDGLEVKPVNSPHPVETTIFWFRSLWEGGYRSYAHLADIVSRQVLDGFVGKGGISPEYRDRVWEEYHRYADVKKIDAGRGLIHGMAEDFVDDPSTRLVLSHYEGSLSNAEKEIGANATFGQSEILIPARGDRIRDAAARYLNGAMPELKRHDALTLLNGKIYTYPPGTPLIKKGQIPDAVLLVISGSAEYIAADTQPVCRFTAGSLIGETEILEGTKSGGSYRTRGYLKALRMPDDLYIHALKRADLKEHRSRLALKRRFLRATAFPGWVVSSPRVDYLANAMEIRPWRRGASIVGGDDLLYALNEGRAVVEDPDESRELAVGEPFNISAVIPTSKEAAAPPKWTSLEESKIAVIPGETVREVPVLAWTLDEITAWEG